MPSLPGGSAVRLLWVVPRFGSEVLGGAETHVRGLVTRAVPAEWSVEVATTCAVDHTTWANALPPGTFDEAGVTVHRFPVGPRDAARYDALHPLILSGDASYAQELEWLSQSVTSPELDAFIERRAADIDLVIFSPYLFGTTVWGAQVVPEQAAHMPCLHDEPYARLHTVRAVIEGARGCLFNAPGEERLARSLYRVRDGGVVGMGYELPATPAGQAGRAPLTGEPYLVYAGRLEEGKRVQVLVEYVTRMREEDASAPRLLLLGRGGYQVPRSARRHVVHAGVVSEGDKRAALAGALALVNASRMESLSLIQLEAWCEGTPCIVDAGSVVMAEHCATSGGGLTFACYEEFSDAVRHLRDDPAQAVEMGLRGREYVLDVYGWPAVSARFRTLIERLLP